MLYEDLGAINGVIEQQIGIIESLPSGEERDKAINSLCLLLSKSNEGWRQYSDEILTDKKLENERQRNEAEIEVRNQQNKNERMRTFFDISKHVLSVAAFVLFEVMAHESEMNDVMPRNLMHVTKNPIKLRL